MTSRSLRRLMHLVLATSATAACGGAIATVGPAPEDEDGERTVGSTQPGYPGSSNSPEDGGSRRRDAGRDARPDGQVTQPDANVEETACKSGTIAFDPSFCCADPDLPQCFGGNGGDEACLLDCNTVCAAVDGKFATKFGNACSASTTDPNVIHYMCGPCGVGRIPGETATCPRGETVAERLAMQAYYEAASVDAFLRLARVLASSAHGDAPPVGRLIRRVEAAAADEARHASLFADLARAHGAIAARPPPLAMDTSLVALAIENAIEGQVRETYGALVALHQAKHATTPELRAAFAAIADDEISHASLSWDLAEWFDGVLSSADRARVGAARAEAVASLRDGATRDYDDVDAALGMPTPQAGRALYDDLFARIEVLPQAA